MSEIRTRQDNPGPGIQYTELVIPNEKNLGKGKFTTVLETNALAGPDPISSIIVNIPVFQLSVTFNPTTKEIPVLLGKADGTDPRAIGLYMMPENIALAESYTFVVTFKNWQIRKFTLNDVPMRLRRDPGTINFWVDPEQNPGAFTEGVNYRWGVFRINNEEVAVTSEGNILTAVMNAGTDRELSIFPCDIDADPESRHMITITWSSEVLNLYFDAKRLHTIKVSEFFD